MNAPELVNQLSKAFDPKMSKARENERAERSFQTTHMLTVSQQLRDSQNTIENLRNQLTVMQARVYDAERARDFGEFKMQFLQAGGGPVFGSASAGPSASHPPRRAAIYKDNPDLVRDDGQVRCERVYPDGGACTEFFSDPSSDDEAEKENRNPSSSSHSGRSSSFSLHDDDTLVNYSLLPSTSGTAAEVKGAPSAVVVDGASNSGVGNI
jgi:TolA-binding protein